MFFMVKIVTGKLPGRTPKLDFQKKQLWFFGNLSKLHFVQLYGNLKRSIRVVNSQHNDSDVRSRKHEGCRWRYWSDRRGGASARSESHEGEIPCLHRVPI
jgi:hypothetical protein